MVNVLKFCTTKFATKWHMQTVQTQTASFYYDFTKNNYNTGISNRKVDGGFFTNSNGHLHGDFSGIIGDNRFIFLT